MNFLYNTGIALYGGAARLASLRSRKVRHMLDGQKETLDRLAYFRRTMAPDGFDVWFHAASLGEFEQARPLIESLLSAKPETKVLLSFFSPSGYEVRRDYDPRVAVVYMPFDLPGRVRQFLDAAKPRMAIFVKYEFWGNYLTELQRRNIPAYIISSIFRPGQIFFRPWGGTFRRILASFSHIFVQDESSRKLLASIGIGNVTVAGDTRFDRVTAIRSKCRSIPEIDTFIGAKPSFTLVVGSSWERDEDVYIDAIRERTDIRAIIAPHEFDKDRLAALRRRLGSDHTMLLSDFSRIHAQSADDAAAIAAKLRFLIIDCFGLLSSLYRYADAAYVGGGFGAGIHNINEAAVYAIPVIFGPRHAKFNEAKDLIRCGGAFETGSNADFCRIIDRLSTDTAFRKEAGQRAGQYIASNIGATPKIMKDIFNIDQQ